MRLSMIFPDPWRGWDFVHLPERHIDLVNERISHSRSSPRLYIPSSPELTIQLRHISELDVGLQFIQVLH